MYRNGNVLPACRSQLVVPCQKLLGALTFGVHRSLYWSPHGDALKAETALKLRDCTMFHGTVDPSRSATRYPPPTVMVHRVSSPFSFKTFGKVGPFLSDFPTVLPRCCTPSVIVHGDLPRPTVYCCAPAHLALPQS